MSTNTSSELLLNDIRSELRQMRTSVMGSETKLKFLDQGEKSFLLHIITYKYRDKRKRETKSEIDL